LTASHDRVEIVRSDNVELLNRPWSEIEISIRGFDVLATNPPEEWWFQFMSDSGIWPRPVFVRRGRSRLLKLQALRPADVTDERTPKT
jgi:hypothetical protein